MRFSFISKSAADTRKLGEIFSILVDGGDVISLSGELGGGKTTFVSGVAAVLCAKQPVSSPSFTLINIYDCLKNGKSLNIVHCDLYRIDKTNDIADIGLEEYMHNRKYIAFIEWADKLAEEFLKTFLEIKFEYIISQNEDKGLINNENQLRKITFNANNEYWQKKIKELNKLVDIK